jgi:lipoprotein-anchoring transpeptidase ErfK/SrfK
MPPPDKEKAIKAGDLDDAPASAPWRENPVAALSILWPKAAGSRLHEIRLINTTRTAMGSRFLANFVAAAGLLVTSAVSFAATDPIDQRTSYGGSAGTVFSLSSGSSPIARTTVTYPGNYKPGTIVINTGERRLYLIQDGGQALRYGIGVGRIGFTWSGVKTVSAKKEWPGWTPPSQMLRRRPELPRYMPGGLDNPLGARAMYLGSSLYRIHGSNEPETIGQAVSSGCFRMTNDDVTDLYARVRVGTTVIVQQ